jgi:L-rhamnose mutarotase
MKAYGLTLQLKDSADGIETYKAHHREPWIEALDGLRTVGVEEMRIFLLGRRLFMYMETTDDFDPARDFARYVEANPRAAEWDELMRTFQEPVHEAGEGEWWAFMEPVFDLEDHLPR